MIIKHLKEIKNRTLIIIISYMLFFIISFFYSLTVLKLIILLQNKLSKYVFDYFIFTSITELFLIYFELSFFLSNILLYYNIFYNLICFLSSGLYNKEYKYFKIYYFLIYILGIFSIFFTHFLMIPFLINFFLSFQKITTINDYINFYFEAKIYDYLKFYKEICFNNFINSQFIAIIISSLYIVNSWVLSKIKANRKYFYFLFLFISTILTPPDIISQIVTYLFVTCFFELSIFLLILKSLNISLVNN